MPQQNAPYTPRWLQLLEAFGLVRAGLVVWLAGLAGLSLDLRFNVLALLSAAACAGLIADTLWLRPLRLAKSAGRMGAEAPAADPSDKIPTNLPAGRDR